MAPITDIKHPDVRSRSDLSDSHHVTGTTIPFSYPFRMDGCRSVVTVRYEICWAIADSFD